MAKICHLSSAEARALELYGRKPRCADHKHITRIAADEMLLDRDARWVGKTGYRIVSGARKFWKKTPSGDHTQGFFAVMQLVDLLDKEE